MSLTCIVQPEAEPVSLDEAKQHCKVEFADDDALISMLIVAARQMAESQTGRALVAQTWKQTFDAFPVAAMSLEKLPLKSVSSVKYYDANGEQQTLDAGAYSVHPSEQSGLVAPVPGACWPATQARIDAVEVRFVAGYGDAVDVPKDVKLWMLLHICNWYDNRGSVGEKRDPLPYVDSLINDYRVVGC